MTRRHLLKISSRLLVAAAAVAATPAARLQSSHAQTPDPSDGEPVELQARTLQPVRRPFGRTFANNLIVREQPSTKAREVRKLTANEVIPLIGQIVGDGPTTYNPIWYQTTDGFVHSANVQPCENALNEAIALTDGESLWGEITVPYAELRSAADPQSGLRTRLYFGCVFRITGVSEGADGKPWYVLADGNGGNIGYAPAVQVRALTAEDFAPISPDVPLENKRIEVNLKAQTATAYEYDKPVFTTRVATGGKYRTPEGVRDFFTIPGEHRIFRKIAGTRMAGGTPGYDYYNLPGVSWSSFFTSSGIAFHGTYWHNDYGKPRSHGCVNLLPEDAHWVFRWTMPVYPHTERSNLRTKREEGSLVKVF